MSQRSHLITHMHYVLTSLTHHPITMNMTLPNSLSSSPSPFSISTLLVNNVNVEILEILIALSMFVTIHSLRQKRQHGLPVWPVLGMLPSLALGLRSNLYDWISDVLHRQNGTFRFKGPALSSLNCVVTADPRNLEHLLKTKFGSFPKGEYFRSTLTDLLGDGIFNADHETWQRQRKAASVEFHSTRFRQLTTQSLVELVHSRLIPVLEDSLIKAASIDLQDVLLRLTFDNVCMIAFGVDPGCLSLGLPDIPFARAFEDATEATVLRFMMPTCVWRAMQWANIGPEKKLKESIKVVDEFANGVIRNRKKELSNYDESGEMKEKERSDLLTVFTRMKDENGDPYYSDRFLRDICVNFILAGRDTSSVALSWFFWMLDTHPAVEERVLEEIRRVLGGRGGGGEVVFTAEEVRRMQYLQAAISEALRLYPSVPVDHKEVAEDEVFPDGTVLKKGTKVIYAIYAMGRMESIWGPDCRDYNPERWLARDGRFMSESAYKFPAFNGGPRLCLGKDFAYFQMKFVAASILLRYRVKVIPGHPVAPKLALTMYIKHGLRVQLIRRHESELRKYMPQE